MRSGVSWLRYTLVEGGMELHLQFHKRGDEVQVSGQPVELRDEQPRFVRVKGPEGKNLLTWSALKVLGSCGVILQQER